MRKIYQSSHWKKISRNKSKKLERRARRSQTFLRVEKKEQRIEEVVKAPINFSIINNTIEMLEFFERLERKVDEGRHIFLDMSEVQDITIDALLYTLSRISYFKKKYGIAKIRGNSPVNGYARNFFEESGFYNFVNSWVRTRRNTKILSIESGDRMDMAVIKKVKDFTHQHLLTQDELKLSSIYTSLGELMENTLQHAYEDESNLTEWWMAASYDEFNKRVNFTFLDNGLTIPVTVEKRLLSTESFNQKFKGIADSDLIKSTLMGEMRSKTKLAYRNKGLPAIYKFLKKREIDDLIVVSNYGFVRAEEMDQVIKLERKFKGTLFTWSYI